VLALALRELCIWQSVSLYRVVAILHCLPTQPTMKSFVEALLREQDARRRPTLIGKTFLMRRKWAGAAPGFLGALPISPSNPAWAQVVQPERIADKRKVIKDETDEAFSKNFEHEK